MRWFRELVGVAVAGLTARKIRTVLIMLGPILGVAAIVAAIGINESSKGHLKAVLRELGTDLIVANAQDSIGGFGGDPRIPVEAVARVGRLPDVVSVTGTLQMANIVTLPFEDAEDYYRAFPVPVIATARPTFSGVSPPANIQGRDQRRPAINRQSKASPFPPGRCAPLGGLASTRILSATL